MPSLLVPPLLLALAAAVVTGAPLIALLRRLKARQIISADAPQRHQSKTGTPTMGGVVIVGASAFAAMVIGPRTPELLAAVVFTIAFSLIGLLDDLLIVVRGKNLGLKARQKLALQVLLGIAFVWWWDGRSGAALGPEAAASAAFHLLLVVAISNAVNLTDGLDGLASGVAVPVFLLLALVASLGSAPGGASERLGIVGNHGLAAFGMAMVGACLGFLWYNAFPATVFMGDTGSLGLGAAAAVTAVMLHAELPLLTAAVVFLVEMVSVIIQVVSFKSTGRRVFRRSPLHHHFEELGWPETKIVARFWIVSAAISALTLYGLLR